jgi:hypothetical protein
LYRKVIAMQSDWASENLQIIRTLMERAAVYRRALAPLMTLIGVSGVVAAVIGSCLNLTNIRALVGYWMAIGLIGLAESFLLIRRQALAAAEPFWSSPTRRVVQALLPPFVTGLAAGLIFLALGPANPISISLLVPLWMVLYGCALHSAGFFMPRGFKLFGWGFVVCGCVVGCAVLCLPNELSWFETNWQMGLFFGGAHLAYGVYLYFTERNRETA